MTAAHYRVGRSRIHGRGLFSARAFATGEMVAEYTGARISKTESARRQSRRHRIFIFALDARHDLDGGGPGHPARFANHSCEPNCEAVAEGSGIYLHALRTIAAGEELTFDYGYPLAVFPGHPCHCGAPSCAGFIVEQSERWRVRRLLRRPGRSLLVGRRGKVTEARA